MIAPQYGRASKPAPKISCTKRGYSDQWLAKFYLAECKRKGGRRQETREYQCGICGKWHLTSMPAPAGDAS